MKRKLTITLTLLFLCFFACQPIPEKDIIVNRGDSDSNPQRVPASAQEDNDSKKEGTDNFTYTLPSVPFTPYDAPAHISREGEDKNDIQVVLPQEYREYCKGKQRHMATPHGNAIWREKIPMICVNVTASCYNQ